jgi:hypothetical protein
VADAPQSGPVQCPHCGHQFLPGIEQGIASAEDQSAQVVQRADDDELSELRIRNVSNLRRGAYRSRSWLIIALAVCAVAAVKLILITVVAVRHRWYVAAIGDGLSVVAAVILVTILVPKIAALTREIRGSRLQPPTDVPDFSNLGDGSQRWKDLDELSGKGGS